MAKQRLFPGVPSPILISETNDSKSMAAGVYIDQNSGASTSTAAGNFAASASFAAQQGYLGAFDGTSTVIGVGTTGPSRALAADQRISSGLTTAFLIGETNKKQSMAFGVFINQNAISFKKGAGAFDGVATFTAAGIGGVTGSFAATSTFTADGRRNIARQWLSPSHPEPVYLNVTRTYGSIAPGVFVDQNANGVVLAHGNVDGIATFAAPGIGGCLGQFDGASSFNATGIRTTPPLILETADGAGNQKAKKPRVRLSKPYDELMQERRDRQAQDAENLLAGMEGREPVILKPKPVKPKPAKIAANDDDEADVEFLLLYG